MLFVSQDFEIFLRVFQYGQPVTHMLWPKMTELVRSLMSKFVSKRPLLSEGAPKKPEDMLDIDFCNKSNCKTPSLVDVNTRARMEFVSALQTDRREMKFRKACLRFYQVSVQYLLNHHPLKSKIMKQAQ